MKTLEIILNYKNYNHIRVQSPLLSEYNIYNDFDPEDVLCLGNSADSDDYRVVRIGFSICYWSLGFIRTKSIKFYSSNFVNIFLC